MKYLIQPRESQLRAMKDIYRTKRRLIWGLPGTGKTKIALDFIRILMEKGKIRRAFIVGPLTSIGVWEEQIEMNCPQVPYQLLTSENRQVKWTEDGIIISNFDFFKPRRKTKMVGTKELSWINKDLLNLIMQWHPDIVVVDEGHKIKNPYTRTAKAIHKLGLLCEYGIDLTGTPFGNKKWIDIWSHFRFLMPDLLDNKFTTFKHRYAIWGGFGGYQLLGYKNTGELHKLVKPYITVINKKGVERKNFLPFRVDMPDKAKQLYKQMEEEFVISIGDKDIVAPIALAKITKLQQISGGFVISNEKVTHPLHDAKIQAVKDIAEKMKESSIDRFIIFARFHWEIKSICEALTDWTTYRITGEESAEERKLAENLYNESGGVAVCQIATGSVSLSFKNTDYAVFYSVDHSHINFTQAQYRIDRDEQTKPCFYYLIQCKGTLDASIYRSLRENRNITNEIKSLVEEARKRI